MYYDFKEPIYTLPSHRILAMLRGEREKVLAIKLDIPEKVALTYLESRFIKHPRSASYTHLLNTIEDSFSRLILPAIETEVRKELRDQAELEAFKVFGGNIKELLLAAPAGQKPVLGVDPGFRTGCKVAALDKTGNFQEYEAIYPNEPQKDMEGSRNTLLRMIEGHEIQLIAIGNGTASRDTEHFVKKVLNEFPEKTRPVCVIVNESGASVYSASEAAQKEFPDFDVTVRGAISIARRLQDPLSELVKIDPKSIGVGQYQHDVNQTELKISLEAMVEHCVNKVGVDINLASEELLKYVSGLNSSIANRIVERREEKGSFSMRKELLGVPKLGKKAFEQAAGFLRIPGSYNPLDNSAVHPERYEFVEMMARTINTSVNDLIGNSALIQSLAKDNDLSKEVGPHTYRDILTELEKPGRDPRDSFSYAQFSDEITEISDLEADMELEGWVTNVTNFGAFVDVGVHQDGLVHISELANRFVKDPKDVVKVGQVVKVMVLSVDEELKRIALSMKRVEQ